MRRTLVVALSLLALAAPAAAVTQRDRDRDRPPRQDVALDACQSGPTDDERFAVFTGSMRAFRGTERMAMRFDLYVRRIGARRWHRVRARGFGTWERSDPWREGFVFTKRVEHLREAAEYRARVRFRWYQANGRHRTRHRRSPLCAEPDQRPDLRVASFDVLPGDDASSARYRVTVENTGETVADAFRVALTAAGRVDQREVPSLPPGEQATVELAGAPCDPGDPPRVEVDPADVVEESDERDNRYIGACFGR